MLDKKGKIFGKVSIIDVLLIGILIVAVVLAAKILMSSKDKQELRIVFYTVEFKEVNQDFCDSIKKDCKVFDAIKFTAIGKVDSFKVKPFTRILKDHETGSFRECQVEDLYNVYLKVKASALVTESMVSVNNYQIKIGKKLPIKGKGFMGETFVTELKIPEEKQ